MRALADAFERARQMAVDLRRKGRRDRGFILVSTIMLFVLVSGTVYWMISTAHRTTQSAINTSDFVESGQLADFAVQNALYTLNSSGSAALPTAAAPATVTTTSGTYTWYADPVTLGEGGKTAVIHAAGTFRKTTRLVQATAIGPRVGGFKTEADKSITYQLAPSTAFSHTVTGKSVTLQNGISIPASGSFATGSIGLLGSSVATDPATGTSAKAAVDYFQYGPAAASVSLPNAVRAPAGMSLDSGFIDDYLARCGGAAPAAWVASQHGGVLVANGNLGCYSSMTFDVPTAIEGSGAFNAFVAGGVTFSDNVTAPTGTGLNIYTKGNVDIRTEDASGTSLTMKNTFLYAPGGLCQTVTSDPSVFRSTSKPLDFTGSLSCATVKAAGQFAPAAPIGAMGDDIFNNDVWYLANYQQPSGSRAG